MALQPQRRLTGPARSCALAIKALVVWHQMVPERGAACDLHTSLKAQSFLQHKQIVWCLSVLMLASQGSVCETWSITDILALWLSQDLGAPHSCKELHLKEWHRFTGLRSGLDSRVPDAVWTWCPP